MAWLQHGRWLPSYPLLGRELVEIAKRRRTYVLRTLSILIASLVLGLSLEGSGSLIGRGEAVVLPIAIVLGCAIVLLLPAMAASSVVREREQGTHVLLLLTPIRPGAMVLQKFAVLLLAMAGVLLAAIPLLGLAYACGGLSSTLLWQLAASLAMLLVQVTAIALAISCWSRGPLTALIAAYLVIAGLEVVLPVLQYSVLFFNVSLPQVPWWVGAFSPVSYVLTSQDHEEAAIAIPLSLMGVALVIARLGIARPMAEPRGGFLFRWLRALDRRFEWLNLRLLGRVSQRDLPQTQPVFWLEVNRRALANPRYLVRIFLPLTVLVLVVTFCFYDELVLFELSCLGLASSVLAVIHATAFSRERTQQSLEVMLTTPLTARSIIIQKARALARLRWGMAAPLVFLILLAGYLGQDEVRYGSGLVPYDMMKYGPALLVAMKLIMIAMIFSLSCWLSLLVGLVLRNSRWAAISALMVLSFYLMVLPLKLAWENTRGSGLYGLSDNPDGVILACPVLLICMPNIAFNDMVAQLGLYPLLAALVCYAALWALLRAGTLWWAGSGLMRSHAVRT